MRYIFFVALLLIGVDVSASQEGPGSDEDRVSHVSSQTYVTRDADSPDDLSGGEKKPDSVLEQTDANLPDILLIIRSLTKDDAAGLFAKKVKFIRREIQKLHEYTPDEDMVKRLAENKYALATLEACWKNPMAYWYDGFLRAKQTYDAVSSTLTKKAIEDAMEHMDFPITVWGAAGSDEDWQRALGAYIFMPDDFVVMGARPAWYGNNLRVQYALAIAAGYGNPVALDYLGEIFSTVGALNEGMRIEVERKSYTLRDLYDLSQKSAKILYAKGGTDSYAQLVATREINGRKEALDSIRLNLLSKLDALDTVDPRVLFDFAYIVKSHPPMAQIPFPTAYPVLQVTGPVDVDVQKKIGEYLEGTGKSPLLELVNAARTKSWQFFNDSESAGKGNPIQSGPLFYEYAPRSADRAAMAHSTAEYLQSLYEELFSLSRALER